MNLPNGMVVAAGQDIDLPLPDSLIEHVLGRGIAWLRSDAPEAVEVRKRMHTALGPGYRRDINAALAVLADDA